MTTRHFRFRKRNGKSTKAKANKALKMVRQLTKNIEHKFYVRSIVEPQIDNDGIVYSLLNNISQGLNDQNRIGDKITIKSIEFRYAWQSNTIVPAVGAANPRGMVCRAIMYWDKTNTLNNPDDIMQATAGSAAPFSNVKHDEQGNYIIIFDKFFRLNPTSALSSMNFKFKRHVNKTVRFDAGTNLILSNDLKLCFITNIGSGDPDQPSAQFWSNIKYTDS